MALIADIPRTSLVREPSVRFSGLYTPTIPGYNFTLPGNADRFLLDINANNAYVIERISFFGSPDVGTWLNAMQDSTDLPKLRFRYKQSPAAAMFPEPVVMANYRQAEERLIFLFPRTKKDQLLVTFTGNIGQPLSLVGETEVFAQANFVIYEVTDQAWVDSHRPKWGGRES